MRQEWKNAKWWQQKEKSPQVKKQYAAATAEYGLNDGAATKELTLKEKRD